MNESEILIVGANGQLGQALQKKYPKARKADISELDISNPAAMAKYDWQGIKVILNAAAFTNVDGAETTEGRIIAWQANALAPANLVAIALKYDMILIHVSTEYVFDGTKNLHHETEPFSPLSVYGASKAAGDIAVGLLPKHFILRTSWVIGEGKNFVRTMLELGKKGVAPAVVSDQIGRLTFTGELVRAIDHLMARNANFGTYNISNGGTSASWADITRKIYETANIDVSVSDITTDKYFADKPLAAKRPLNSIFDLSKIESTGFSPKDWQEDLAIYIKKELSL